MKKMNNKGFSLVELIVVVLIMAIIAVALAPQVMKWVENSRISTDATNYESMIENLQLAIADKDVYKFISADTANTEIPACISTKGASIGTTAASLLAAGTPVTTKPTATTFTSADAASYINWALTKIDASWTKIAKKASAEPVSGKDYYEITITCGKQANVKRSETQNPDKLKDGTDLS
jgi:prepilin-type N-terminal cleavage/methylation domain-containing protein